MSSIALRQYVLGDGKIPFSHNYLVFYDDNGNAVEEFHGVPENPHVEIDIGRSSDYLRAKRYQGKSGKWYREGQPEQMLWQGSYDEATARWRAAQNALDEINRRGLTYNLAGSDLNGPRDWDAPVPPVIAGNRNSVNRTLVEAMGLRLPSRPYMAPGIENPLLRQQEIEQMLRDNGLPIRKRSLF